MTIVEKYTVLRSINYNTSIEIEIDLFRGTI